jgi:hypothetical protein
MSGNTNNAELQLIYCDIIYTILYTVIIVTFDRIWQNLTEFDRISTNSQFSNNCLIYSTEK